MYADLDNFVRVAKAGNMSAVARDWVRLRRRVQRSGYSRIGPSAHVSSSERHATSRSPKLAKDTCCACKGSLERAVRSRNFRPSRSEKPSGLLRVTAPTIFSRLSLSLRLPRFLNVIPI